MRLIFLGAGEFGLPTLARLHAEHTVLAVVTQPDRPAGRKQQLTPTPIGQWAAEAGLAVLKTDNANDAGFVAQIAALHAEAAIVIAFGQKLSPELIAALGPFVVNLHSSLLPKYRGAAPINWAVIQGEKETGLSIIALAQRMDAGVVYSQVRTPIAPTETAGELHDRLAAMGPAAIDAVLREHRAGTLKPLPQNDTQATRAPKLSKADSRIEWDQPADVVRCRIHGLTPWPGAAATWVRVGGQEQVLLPRRVSSEGSVDTGRPPGTVLGEGRIAVRGGSIRLLEVQLPGGRTMTFDEFSRGHRMQPGDTLR
jgi:methionyl-tRNA formyltransferase